eukprot:1175492-Pyramimonas_sp.AAC.1
MVVPAPHALKTDGFQRPSITRDGGSSAPRRRLQRQIFTRDSGSSASCLEDSHYHMFTTNLFT